MNDKLELHRIDPDTGEEVETTAAERAEALKAFRDMFLQGKIEFAPGSLDGVKISQDEVLAMIADAFDAKQ